MAVLEIDWNPPPKHLRQFAFLFAALALIVGTLAFWQGRASAGATACGAAAVVAALGLARPAAVRPLWVGLSLAAFPIGWVVSHVVLGLVFYAVLTPIGLALRLAGRDLLALALDRKAATYWSARTGHRDVATYLRQF